MKKIIIDTDTASDDAVALVMALRNPYTKVLAITTVAGNVEIEKATRNALMSVEYAKSYQPPVYVGCGKPLMVELETADQVHGLDGMGDLGTLKEPTISATSGHAVDAILEILEAAEDQEIELLTLGPLTNIALAILMKPEVMKKLKHITIMGGALPHHNPHTVSAEFNIMVDPDAADIVCRFSVPFTMVTLEVCMDETALLPKDIEYFRSLGEIGRFCVDCNATAMDKEVENGNPARIELPDPTAYAVLAEPDIAVESFRSYTRIERRSSFARGATIFENHDEEFRIGNATFIHHHDAPNSRIVTKIDAKRFKEMLAKLVQEA
jgi:purine nucleosidase